MAEHVTACDGCQLLLEAHAGIADMDARLERVTAERDSLRAQLADVGQERDGLRHVANRHLAAAGTHLQRAESAEQARDYWRKTANATYVKAAKVEAERDALRAEVGQLRKLMVHCNHCGADYSETGLDVGCSCRLRAQLATAREDGRREALREARVLALDWSASPGLCRQVCAADLVEGLGALADKGGGR